jgi:hypothetical protein
VSDRNGQHDLECAGTDVAAAREIAPAVEGRITIR